MMDKIKMDSCINEYKQRVRKLEEKNAALEAENVALKYTMNDIEATNHIMQETINCMCDDIEQEVAAECGCVVLANSTCYQDFIGILMNNGYTVEIEPIHKGRSLKITIKEGDE
jgi:hypothetical protein